MRDLNVKLDAILISLYSFSGLAFMLLSAYYMFADRGPYLVIFAFFTGCYFNLLAAIKENK